MVPFSWTALPEKSHPLGTDFLCCSNANLPLGLPDYLLQKVTSCRHFPSLLPWSLFSIPLDKLFVFCGGGVTVVYCLSPSVRAGTLFCSLLYSQSLNTDWKILGTKKYFLNAVCTSNTRLSSEPQTYKFKACMTFLKGSYIGNFKHIGKNYSHLSKTHLLSISKRQPGHPISC